MGRHALSAPRTPGNRWLEHSKVPSDVPAGAILPPHRTQRSVVPFTTVCGARVNVLEGLQIIRQRLVGNGADDATIECVDLIARRAALPAAAPASAQSLLQLVRMLMRTPVANANVRVYNDFVRLEEELSMAATAMRERREAEDAKPVPKTKKYYKELREREKRTSS